MNINESFRCIIIVGMGYSSLALSNRKWNHSTFLRSRITDLASEESGRMEVKMTGKKGQTSILSLFPYLLCSSKSQFKDNMIMTIVAFNRFLQILHMNPCISSYEFDKVTSNLAGCGELACRIKGVSIFFLGTRVSFEKKYRFLL